MPYIVNLMKKVVLILFFFAIIGLVLAALLVTTNSLTNNSEGVAGIGVGILVGGIGGLVLTVFMCGAFALAISNHDRNNEIAEGVHRIADALEARDAGEAA
jgi:hypothetical protein